LPKRSASRCAASRASRTATCVPACANSSSPRSATSWASADLVARGYFGSGAVNARLADRVGDYTLIARGRFALRDRLPGERRHVQIGVHGGLSDDEMRVPLIVARA